MVNKRKSTHYLMDILPADWRSKIHEMRIAKLFKDGADQAVRLPAEFRFDGDEVYISRDDTTGDVVLSSHPGAKTWSEFFDSVGSIDVPADFMAERPMNIPLQMCTLFGNESL